MLHFQLVDGLGRVRRCGLCWRRCVTGAGFEVSRTYATSSMFSASCLLLDTRALQLLLLLAFAMPSPSIETLSFRNFLGMMSCHSIGKVTKAVSKQKKSREGEVRIPKCCVMLAVQVTAPGGTSRKEKDAISSRGLPLFFLQSWSIWVS